ncbi:MAG TPA: phosphate ABC transporter permease subunit PstC, partial [Eubacteriaceae bacterium]|nr:phosphate ABC transporter permease subunit PstC [Eubacteriaceae bacterium]
MNKSTNVRELIAQKQKESRDIWDPLMPKVFLAFGIISVITTIGIVLTLVVDAFRFFQAVSITEIFSTELAPLNANPSFGILPLINGTIMVTLVAMLVAVPVGLSVAIFLSQFSSDKVRKAIKPVMEILAGIPTIVYGFFAYSFVTPLLMNIVPGLQAKNVLSAGIVMGIMIIPMVASLSEDAMNSVPTIMKEGAYGLGSTRLEVTLK